MWLDQVFNEIFQLEAPLANDTADEYFDHINDVLSRPDFLPRALTHLATYFRIRPLNWLFPVSVSALSFATACWLERIYAAQTQGQVVGFALLTAITALALLEHWVMVLPIMAAAVMVLALFGSYSVQQSMGDVYIMLGLGVGMFFLEKFGFSAAPLVLGLILGPIAESNFTTGSLIAQAQDGPLLYFMTGPLNIFLIILVIASVAYSFWSNMVHGKKTALAEAQS